MTMKHYEMLVAIEKKFDEAIEKNKRVAKLQKTVADKVPYKKVDKELRLAQTKAMLNYYEETIHDCDGYESMRMTDYLLIVENF